MKKIFAAAIMLIVAQNLSAQKSKTSVELPPSQPKLIVGIVIDQMAYDFLYRYSAEYSNGGFNKLIDKGYSCENTHYNYIPTYTGPGHTCIYTGSVPSIDGIISNDWFDEKTKSNVYCTSDASVNTVGGIGIAGKMSPHLMLTTTITDQLQLFTNDQSKVIGIALKDRSAILPAGHMADGAYWFDGLNNAWITSTYYMKELPQWVKDFNAKNLASTYLLKPWTLLKPINDYSASNPDNEFWEGKNAGEISPVFPHLFTPTAGSTEIIKATPWGNTFTSDFVKEAITAEQLGKDSITDFLTISFSSTDYIGHQYGPTSMESEDCYLRMDADLAGLIHFLDSTIGKSNYLLFLTADHGVSISPDYAKSVGIPAGVIIGTAIKDSLNKNLQQKFGSGQWVAAYENQQIYFNDSLLDVKNVTLDQIEKHASDYLMKIDGVANVYSTSNILNCTMPGYQMKILSNSIYPKRSGDLQIILEPGWFEDRITGTTHGSFYNYDTHVPLIWYGWKVKHGGNYDAVDVCDISASLAAMLHITEPNGCIGKPISGLMLHLNGF